MISYLGPLLKNWGTLLLSLALTASLQNILPGAEAACYFPDGTERVLDGPCTSDATSACCGRGYACLSNNLCMLTQYAENLDRPQFARGSCTDRTWKSDNCAQVCVGEGDTLSDAVGVQKCRNTDNRYICIDQRTADAGAEVACGNDTFYFEFPGTASVLTIIGVTTSSSVQSSTTAPTPTTTSMSAPSTPSTSASSSSSTPTVEPSSKPKDNSVAIGAGVGVPLGVIAVAVVIYLLARYRRSRKATQEKQGDSENREGYYGSDSYRSDYKSAPVDYAQEIQGGSAAQELPGPREPQELAAGPTILHM